MVDRHTLLWCMQQAGLPRHKFGLLPDFLVISPPKTGSTWLADNLRHHPQLFVPAIKEVKYFSTFCDWLGLEWYLDHFAESAGQLKGEASPSYAILPEERIRLIRALMPEVKLVYLMRDPVSRAWSHARHTFRYREASFADRAFPLEGVTERHWHDSFTHPWLLACGDYLGQLSRWLNVFPREQVFVGFFEDLLRRPEALLRDLLAFLGVDHSLPLDQFPIHEQILKGMEVLITPPLEHQLRRILCRRTDELVAMLRDRLNLSPPPEWGWYREPSEDGPAVPFPEDALALEATFPSARCVAGEHRGFEIVCNRGRYFALPPGLVPDPPELEPERWLRLCEQRRCFEADSLAELRQRIDRHSFDQLESTRQELGQARKQVARLRRQLEPPAERRGSLGKRLAGWLRRSLGVSHPGGGG